MGEALVGEPIVVPSPEAAGPKEKPVIPLTRDEPIKPEPVAASDVTVAQLAALVRSYEGRDREGSHGNGGSQNPPPPNMPDQGGWCGHDRGPQGCSWHDWDWDDHGNPVFSNRFQFAVDITWCDPFTGRWLTVRVDANSARGIELDIQYRDRDFAFMVTAAAGPGGFAGGVSVEAERVRFAAGVSFGTFNHRPDDCGRDRDRDRCRPSYRDLRSTQFRYRDGGGWRYGNVDVYDCGCNDRVQWNGQWYDRVWVNGTQETLVIRHPAVPERNEVAYLEPVAQKPTPIATQFESVECPCGDGKRPEDVQSTAAGSDLPPGGLPHWWPWVALLGILAVGGGGILLASSNEDDGSGIDAAT